MPVSFDLVVCITSTALFDCRELKKIWRDEGPDAFKKHQKASVHEPLKPGVGFRLVQTLLELNNIQKNLVEVVLVSRNDSQSSERVRHSISYYKLPITRMSFTDGGDVTRYLKAWNCNLFLTTDEEQVRTVLSIKNCPRFDGIAAGLVCHISDEKIEAKSEGSSPNDNESIDVLKWPDDQVRIVFDGDGVLFSDESESVFRAQGLEAFQEFEREKTDVALAKGPMHEFAVKLQNVRNKLGQEHRWRIRTFLVTARNGFANERAVNTLQQWGLEIDEMHFLGGMDKTPFLIAIKPAIFFDDSTEHIDRAKRHVPSVHVLYGVTNRRESK